MIDDHNNVFTTRRYNYYLFIYHLRLNFSLLGSGTIHLRMVVLHARTDFFATGLYCKFSGSSRTTVLYAISGVLSPVQLAPSPVKVIGEKKNVFL